MSGTVWFDEARVERTITRQFVASQLSSEAAHRLDGALAFGDGLTDCTYWEWLKDKGRRLFLILVDLGLPGRIFTLIDNSWEDDDLPIQLHDVGQLQLTPEKDVRLEREFHIRQFFYLVRTLGQGQHIDYEDHELVPLDVIEKRPGSSQDLARLPDLPALLCRRRVTLGLETGCVPKDDFMWEVNSIKDIQNAHVACYWASYTHRGEGYVLLTLPGEYKLSVYLTNTPPSVKNLDKGLRRRLVLDWILCMVDTLCFVHSRGASLGNIKPSTIQFTRDHHVVFTDASRASFNESAQGGNSFERESYNYAAPEQWAKQSATPTSPRSRPPWATNNGSDNNAQPTFSISRGKNHPHHHNHNINEPPPPSPRAHPSSNPQAADIFSLGCIILELLSYGLLKRSSSAFASSRAAKHKSPGRGGAVPDSSFHKNPGQVEAWMAGLAKEAAGKLKQRKDDDGRAAVFATVAPLLRVVEKMLGFQPAERPSAPQVREWTYQILTEAGGLAEPHCGARGYRQPATQPETLSFSAGGGGIARMSQSSSFLSLSDGASEFRSRTASTASTSSIHGAVERPLPPLSGSSRNAGLSRSSGGQQPQQSRRGSDGDRSTGWGLLGGGSKMSMQSLRISTRAKPWTTRSFADSAISTGSQWE